MRGLKTRIADDGFTLVETLIAFAVLSVVLAIVSSSTAGGLELLHRGAQRQVALREAQSLLEAVGYAFPLEEGALSGQTGNGRYAWLLEISPKQDERQSALRDARGRMAALYSVRATITWRERFGEQSAVLSSERLGYVER